MLIDAKRKLCLLSLKAILSGLSPLSSLPPLQSDPLGPLLGELLFRPDKVIDTKRKLCLLSLKAQISGTPPRLALVPEWPPGLVLLLG